MNERDTLLPEVMFLRALSLERKRAERSRKLFVLMLLEPVQPTSNGNGHSAFSKTVSAISSSIRETDVAGWYKERSALGVIFAELGTADKTSILKTLRAKVTAALQSSLRAEELSHVRMSFHCFPDDRDNHETGMPPTTTLYPDLVQRDEARKVSYGVKQAIDALGSLMALIILSPIFLAIPVASTRSSSGHAPRSPMSSKPTTSGTAAASWKSSPGSPASGK